MCSVVGTHYLRDWRLPDFVQTVGNDDEAFSEPPGKIAQLPIYFVIVVG